MEYQRTDKFQWVDGVYFLILDIGGITPRIENGFKTKEEALKEVKRSSKHDWATRTIIVELPAIIAHRLY